MSRLPRVFLERPIAHWGLHGEGAPENSLSAFRAAREAGYGVELDVQLTADGRAVVFHDDTLDRMTAERGPVAARTADELAGVALTGGREDRIPTLAQALEAAGDAPVLVEVKRQPDAEALGRLAAAVAEAVAAHPGPAAVMSFDPAAVLWFRDHAPEVPRGLVSMDFARRDRGEGDRDGLTTEERRALADLEAFDAAGCDFVSYRWRDLARPAVQALRARRVPALCWTTRAPEEDAEARRLADNVTFEHYRPETPRRH